MAMFYPDRDAGLSMLMAAKMSLCSITRTSLVAQMVQNLPAMQETWVRSLGWEELSGLPARVVLPGESHGQRSLAGYSPWGRRVGRD